MGVPVAKTQGMKTGCRWPFASRGNKQRRCETRPSSTRPLWRRASPRERIAAISNSSTTVQVAAARSPTSLPTFLSCEYNRAAPDPCRRTTSEVRIISDLPQRHREQHPQEAPPRGGASFLFERGLPPTETPCATSVTSMMECTPAWRAIAHRTIVENGPHSASRSGACSIRRLRARHCSAAASYGDKQPRAAHAPQRRRLRADRSKVP